MTQEENHTVADLATPDQLDGSERYEIVTRHIVMEKDLNAFGNLFGGIMLSWLDEAAALYVMDKIGYANFVTISLDDVVFKAPAFRGDALAFHCRVIKVGRSSIQIQTKAIVHDPSSREQREIITCLITFVCLRDGKTFPYFQSETYRTWLQRAEDDTSTS